MLFFILKPQNISIFSVVIASRARANTQKKVRFLRQFQHQSGAKRKENYPFVRSLRGIHFLIMSVNFAIDSESHSCFYSFCASPPPLHKYFELLENMPTQMIIVSHDEFGTKDVCHITQMGMVASSILWFNFACNMCEQNDANYLKFSIFLNWTFFLEALMMAQNDDIKEKKTNVANNVSMIISWKNAMLIKIWNRKKK